MPAIQPPSMAPRTPRRLPFYAALSTMALGLGLGLGPHGAALALPVVVYQNDFESPATTSCPDYQYNAHHSALVSDYGANFVQLNTADRLCIGSTDPAAAPVGDRYVDPSGQAGKYFVGFYGSVRTAVTEAFGLALDPAGSPQLYGTVQLAHVRLAGYPSATSPGIGSPVGVTVNYYRLPAGQTTFRFSLPATMGSPAPVLSMPSNTPLTAIKTDTVSVTNSLGPTDLDWRTHNLAVDTSGFAPGDRLVIAFTGLAFNEYMAVDNLLVMRDDGRPAAPVPVNAWWTLLLAGLGMGWLGRRRMMR